MVKNFIRPLELAERAKEETVPISLRLKERTVAYFGFIANEYKASQSSLINELLNSYVEQNLDERFEEFFKRQIISSYLKREINTIINMSDEQMFRENGWLEECENAYEPPYDDIIGVFRRMDAGDDELNRDGLIFSLLDEGVFLVPSGRGRCAVYSNEGISEENRKRYGYCIPEFRYIVEIPHRKWLLVTAVIRRYAEKYYLAYGGKRGFTTAEIRNFARVVDESGVEDKKQFVTEVISFLSGVDFPEKHRISRRPRYSFNRRGAKVEAGERFDVLKLRENLDLTSTKPDLIVIYRGNEEVGSVMTDTWNEVLVWILAKIYEVDRSVLGDPDDFNVNPGHFLRPLKVGGSMLYVEGNKNANELMGFAKKYLERAPFTRVEMSIRV